MKTKEVLIGDSAVKQVVIGGDNPLVLIGGPCAIESDEHTLYMAQEIKKICDKIGMPFIYKSCYDKDCRSSSTSFLGLGLDPGLAILKKVREDVGIPVTTDFSNVAWAKQTGEVVDLIQIPAYLCRQTHLLVAAGKTGKPINIKKGQFMSPWNMKNSVMKIENAGNNNIILTERGTFLGYNMLFNDMRALPIMKETGYPVCYDATHSIQMPTSLGTISGGQREFIPSLSRAAVASGVNAVFMEIHDNPDKALSDSSTQINIKYVEKILSQLKEIHELKAKFIEKWGEDNVK